MKKLVSVLASLVIAFLPGVAQAKTLPSVSTNSPVVIAGSFASGGALRIAYDDSDSGINSTVEWFASGAKIVGAAGRTLILDSDSVGKAISAKVTLRKTGFKDTLVTVSGLTVTSELPTRNQMTESGWQVLPYQPECNGVAQSSFLSAPKVGWNVWFDCNPFYNLSNGSPVYGSSVVTWYRDATLITGATSHTYKVQAADAGKKLWVVYRGTYSNGFQAIDMQSVEGKIPTLMKVVKPTIVGKLLSGTVLTVGTKGWETGATLSYQWFRNYAPIIGATGATYTVQSGDLGKAIHVMVSGQKAGVSPGSAISTALIDANTQAFSARAAYTAVFENYTPTTTEYDITYETSPNITATTIAREKKLIQAAADYWASEYTPSEVNVVYMTKDDAAWAEGVIAAHSGWNAHIPGGITKWVNDYSCGFALAFTVDNKQVFIQCMRNGADIWDSDKQTGPHEYTHWIQYKQNSDLGLYGVPWLIEGQANFFGVALGIAPNDPDLRFVNMNIVNHATQYDIYNGFAWGSLKLLDILQSGDSVDIQAMLRRQGTVFDSYAIGHLVSEFLVAKYGANRYVQYMKTLVHDHPFYTSEQIAKNAIDFYAVYGFEFADLGKFMAPYLEARSAQLRKEFLERDKNAVKPGSTLNSTQQLPVFAGTSASINSNQMDWMIRRLKDGNVTKVTCNWRYLKTSTVAEKARYLQQATNACAWANTELLSYERTPVITITSTQVSKTADAAKVFLTFKN